MLKQKEPGERYRRMPLEAEVLVLLRGESWDTQGIDISATGLLVLRPDEWQLNGDAEYALELILDEETIALMARVARSDELGVAFEFTRVPPGSEAPLWRLLGAFADATEKPR